MDRDGTINLEVEYLSDPDDLELLPGAAVAIRQLNRADIPVIVITNQAGVGRGYFTQDTVREIHARLETLLGEQGARLDAIYYCPHHPDDGCDCRKPRTGMLLQAAQEHNIALDRSAMIGDKLIDLEAGRRAGCQTVLVLTGYGQAVQKQLEGSGQQPDFVAQDLREAARWILEQRINSKSDIIT